MIGTGANDPQKMDPTASRDTRDHSIMYIFAVALEDGGWRHEASYAPERAQRPATVALWRKIRTVEDARWTARYHDIRDKAFGGRVIVTLEDGRTIADELALADAHPQGARPQYVAKFRNLAEGIVPEAEQDRFLAAVEHLPLLGAGELGALGIAVPADRLLPARPGLFDRPAPVRTPETV